MTIDHAAYEIARSRAESAFLLAESEALLARAVRSNDLAAEHERAAALHRMRAIVALLDAVTSIEGGR